MQHCKAEWNRYAQHARKNCSSDNILWRRDENQCRLCRLSLQWFCPASRDFWDYKSYWNLIFIETFSNYWNYRYFKKYSIKVKFIKIIELKSIFIKLHVEKYQIFKTSSNRKQLIPSFSCNSNLFIFSIAVFLIQIIINPLRRYRRRPAMYDGVPAQWQKPADQMRNRTDDAAYVFLGIFLAGLAVPAAFLIWAIATSLTSVFGWNSRKGALRHPKSDPAFSGSHICIRTTKKDALCAPCLNRCNCAALKAEADRKRLKRPYAPCSIWPFFYASRVFLPA